MSIRPHYQRSVLAVREGIFCSILLFSELLGSCAQVQTLQGTDIYNDPWKLLPVGSGPDRMSAASGVPATVPNFLHDCPGAGGMERGRRFVGRAGALRKM